VVSGKLSATAPAYSSNGGGSNPATSPITPAYPATIAANDLLILIGAVKANTSVDTFDDLLTAYISEHYPDAIVEYGASNWFVDDDDRDTARSIMLDITDAADRIFSDGMFWVTEETGQ